MIKTHRLVWIPAAGIAAALSLLAGAARAVAEADRPQADRPPAPRPNILLCIADDASYPHMGAYGCTWVKTPGFDRVAREGVLFTGAYTPNAKCAPSRSCILTGRNSWQLEAAANHICYFPAKFKTYAEVLGEHGYFVGYTGKGWAPGNAGQVDGRPRQLAGPSFSKRRSPPPTSGISACDYAANFADFLAARPEGKPFCFWYGGFEPHRGYEYGSGIAKGGKRISDVPQVPAIWPDNDTVRTDMLDYAFEIEHFDRHLQRMLAMLQQRGELHNTLVLVTADNGLPFPRCKGQEYEYSNHLPLAAMWPDGIKAPGRTVDDLVSFIDFAPTFFELAGVEAEAAGMHPCQGRSLTDIFFSERSGVVNPGRDHVLIGKERHDIGRPHDWGYPIRGIVKDGFLFLRNFEPDRWPAGDPETGYLNSDGSPTKTVILEGRGKADADRYWRWSFGKRPQQELYRLRDDPACLENLAGQPRYAEVERKLDAQLVAELKQQGDPRMFGRGQEFDEYPYADASFRGFYERYMRGEDLPNTGWVNRSDYQPPRRAN